MIMIIRHAEKPHGGRPHGVTAEGNHDLGSLTVAGWVRAGALVELLASAFREPPDQLRRPDRIVAANYRHGQSKRSIETVRPLADRLGQEIDTRFYEGDEKDLATAIRDLSGTTLVSWHHETINEIVAHLGDVVPPVPRKWPGHRFDVVWIFTRDGDGWAFDQVPHPVAPGDRDEPIEDNHADHGDRRETA